MKLEKLKFKIKLVLKMFNLKNILNYNLKTKVLEVW